MLYGQLEKKETYKAFLTHSIWDAAFAWIAENANKLPDGEHSIQDKDIYANIQTANTITYTDGLYEVHKEYIDIHYCISGEEKIAYAPVGQLVEKELNKDKDYQLFLPTEQYSTCLLQPHSFAIFFPTELHMPKLQSGDTKEVHKVVIKIKKSILEV